MEQVTISILTLLALYALYSECIKLPAIVKKNKKLCYALVIGLFFYYHQNNVVEGSGGGVWTVLQWVALICGVIWMFWSFAWSEGWKENL